jgi:predicted enzyme related to lactoylglutathione lyase
VGERTRYEPGAFCWAGLAASNPADATAFYTSLFDWQDEEQAAGGGGSYTVLRHAGKEVAVIYGQSEQARAARVTPHWTTFVSVQDADAIVVRACQLGGQLLRDPFELRDAGRVATMVDPVGAVLSLWQPRSHIGAQLVNDFGALCWMEHVSDDLDRAKSFYGDLFGWEYEAVGGNYTGIRNAGRRNGGMRGRTEGERGMPPNWLPYFRVESAEAEHEAELLGGQTLLPPSGTAIGRRAVIVDPQGAAFGILEDPAGFG